MNGVLNIFKPKGMSSFDAVRIVKKVAGTGKVGHTGTLDPEATGVLPICIGKATKIIDYIICIIGRYIHSRSYLNIINDTDRPHKSPY